MEKFEIGTAVMVHDNYRFAIPLEGEVKDHGQVNNLHFVELKTSNAVKFPVGCCVWVHGEQLRLKC